LIALRELQERGCLAAGYRLSGTIVDHVCCRHLYGDDRLLTVWPDEGHVTVVALGRHDGSALDVYDALLNALGLDIPDAERDKPPCCGKDDLPPVEPQLASEIADAVERHVGRQRGR
jgi:hypothetical protein